MPQGSGCGWNLCLDGGPTIQPLYPLAASGYAQFDSYAATCAARPAGNCAMPLPPSSWQLPPNPPSGGTWADSALRFEVMGCNRVLQGQQPQWTSSISTTSTTTTSRTTTSTSTTSTVPPCYVNYTPRPCRTLFDFNSGSFVCGHVDGDTSMTFTCQPQYRVINNVPIEAPFIQACQPVPFGSCETVTPPGYSALTSPGQCGQCK